jgi:hypothetical protein
MTGLLRWAGCDLFIHGTGGGVYDRVTERWFAAWLGERALAPANVVSATRLVDFGFAPIDERAGAQIVARGHRARHDPSLVGDVEAGRHKREIVERIAGLPRRSAARAAQYGEMLRILERVRAERAHAIHELEQRAQEQQSRAGAMVLARDRTWSLVFHAPGALKSLREHIDGAFADVT